MPYIPKEIRENLAEGRAPWFSGELNYLITGLIMRYMAANGGVSYANINAVVGALDCAKMEFYRRVAVPYENTKLSLNGDVYD